MKGAGVRGWRVAVRHVPTALATSGREGETPITARQIAEG